MAKTMLHSLRENNKNEKIRIFLMSDDMTTDEVMQYLSGILNGMELVFIRLERELLQKAQVSEAFGYYPLYKFFLNRLLPDTVDKVLWLDTDIVIDGPIREMYDTDISKYCFAACLDNITIQQAIPGKHIDRFQVKTKEYYNAGVMLINMKKLYEKVTSDELLSYYNHNPDITHAEQDIFNLYMNDSILQLPKRYNHHPFSWVKNNENVKSVIIHYIGARKPTDYKYLGGRYLTFWRYAGKAGTLKRTMLINFIQHYWFILTRKTYFKLKEIVKL